MSLKTKLYNKIKNEGRLSYGQMCQFVAEEGFKVSTGERKLRDLVTEGKIYNEYATSKRNTQYISAYLLKPQEKKVSHFVPVTVNGQVVMREELVVK